MFQSLERLGIDLGILGGRVEPPNRVLKDIALIGVGHVISPGWSGRRRPVGHRQSIGDGRMAVK